MTIPQSNRLTNFQRFKRVMALIFILAVWGMPASIRRGQSISVNNLTVSLDANLTNGLSINTGSLYYVLASGQVPLFIPSMDAFNPNGNFSALSISGWANISQLNSAGSNFAFGTWSNGTANFTGADLNFHDNGDYNSSNITFLGTSPNVTWSWLQSTSGNAAVQMLLDNRGNLTVTDTLSGNYIAFSPANITFTLGENGTTFTTDTMSLMNYSSGAGAPITYVSSGGTYPIVLNGNSTSSPLVSLGVTNLQGSSTTGALIINGTSNTTINPSLQTISFNNGFVISGNAAMGHFTLGSNGLMMGSAGQASSGGIAVGGGKALGSPSAAIGINANATHSNSIAIGSASNSTNIGTAIGFIAKCKC